MTHTDTIETDTRRSRILQGATEVFLSYGFQRATMDDIARAAEISRPALYLEFRNKADIYRALAAEFVQDAVAGARTALANDEPLSERLVAAFMRALARMLEIEQTPHGAEILDLKVSLAAQIVHEGRTAMGKLVEEAIAAEAVRQGASGPAGDRIAADLAAMLLDAVDGMKMHAGVGNDPRGTVASYVSVVIDALAVRVSRTRCSSRDGPDLGL